MHFIVIEYSSAVKKIKKKKVWSDYYIPSSHIRHNTTFISLKYKSKSNKIIS
jgi:hypothetical protein